MCDLNEMAENAAAIARAYKSCPKPEKPTEAKPSERVENAATAALVALPLAVLMLGPLLS